jgi:hypothetical protein
MRATNDESNERREQRTTGATNDRSDESEALKSRPRHLDARLKSANKNSAAVVVSPRSHPRSKKVVCDWPQLTAVPGYSMLTVGTKIALSSALPMIMSPAESMMWTIAIPLLVIMELDGLSSNTTPQLAEAAQPPSAM